MPGDLVLSIRLIGYNVLNLTLCLYRGMINLKMRIKIGSLWEGNMLDDVGLTAGEIWHYLEKHDGASVRQLTQELKRTERMVLLGIGWPEKAN